MASLPASREKTPPSLRYVETNGEIIRLAAVLYVRTPLSLRNVENLLHERGVAISPKTVCNWCPDTDTLGAADAANLLTSMTGRGALVRREAAPPALVDEATLIEGTDVGYTPWPAC